MWRADKCAGQGSTFTRHEADHLIREVPDIVAGDFANPYRHFAGSKRCGFLRKLATGRENRKACTPFRCSTRLHSSRVAGSVVGQKVGQSGVERAGQERTPADIPGTEWTRLEPDGRPRTAHIREVRGSSPFSPTRFRA